MEEIKFKFSLGNNMMVAYQGEEVRILSTTGLRKYATIHKILLKTYKDLKKLLMEHGKLPKYVEYQLPEEKIKQLELEV